MNSPFFFFFFSLFGTDKEFVTVINEDHRCKVSNTEITAPAQAGGLSMQECVASSNDSSSLWSAVHSLTTVRQKVQSRAVKIPDIKETLRAGGGGGVFTSCELVRADEDDEGALPTVSEEGPCDSSLWCCSGDKLSLLLSSSNAYESSCFGNLP